MGLWERCLWKSQWKWLLSSWKVLWNRRLFFIEKNQQIINVKYALCDYKKQGLAKPPTGPTKEWERIFLWLGKLRFTFLFRLQLKCSMTMKKMGRRVSCLKGWSLLKTWNKLDWELLTRTKKEEVMMHSMIQYSNQPESRRSTNQLTASNVLVTSTMNTWGQISYWILSETQIKLSPSNLPLINADCYLVINLIFEFIHLQIIKQKFLHLLITEPDYLENWNNKR